MQTLCVIFKGVFSKKWTNFNVEIMTLICGFQNADEYFKILLQRCEKNLQKDPNCSF